MIKLTREELIKSVQREQVEICVDLSQKDISDYFVKCFSEKLKEKNNLLLELFEYPTGSEFFFTYMAEPMKNSRSDEEIDKDLTKAIEFIKKFAEENPLKKSSLEEISTDDSDIAAIYKYDYGSYIKEIIQLKQKVHELEIAVVRKEGEFSHINKVLENNTKCWNEDKKEIERLNTHIVELEKQNEYYRNQIIEGNKVIAGIMK